MMIVDSQVHIWGANTPERPWPARHEPHKPQPITAQDLLREMDGAGVNACVLVPPSWEGERNDVCIGAAQKHPKRMFWGSDLSRLPCSYRQSLTYMSEDIPWLSASGKDWILGRGLCEWLGWESRE